MTAPTIAKALDSLSKVIAGSPDKALVTFAPVTASLIDGLKCRVTGPSGEQIETDMPPRMGGSNSQPSPGWYFRAALAACFSTVIAQQAARGGIGLTRLEVTIDADGDQRGLLGLDDSISAGHLAIRSNVRIGARDASPEQLEMLVRWARDHSPVSCTVRDAPANTLDVHVV